jgi:hypothetical protein
MRGSGGMCGGKPRRQFCCRIILTKIKREGDGAMVVGGRHQTGGHNNQLKVGVGLERDIGEGAQLWRNVWGGAFRNRLAAAIQATKNIKIKTRRGLRWLQNNMKNATINQKRAALMDRRWNGTRERRGRWGSVIPLYWGQSSWAGGGKLRQNPSIYYFILFLRRSTK